MTVYLTFHRQAMAVTERITVVTNQDGKNQTVGQSGSVPSARIDR